MPRGKLYFSTPFSCQRKKDFQQKKERTVESRSFNVLSPKSKEKNSNVEKGVLKEHFSACLSSQWKENLPGKCKGPINIQLSTPLSDGLKEILSQFLKVARKDQFSVTPWGATTGAPPRALREGREAQSRVVEEVYDWGGFYCVRWNSSCLRGL
jgi:hypothetical protein